MEFLNQRKMTTEKISAVFGVPKSILTMFNPSNDEDKAWLENQLKALAETKKAPTFKIGDLIKCTCDYDIEWGNGFKLEKGKEFVIKVVGSDDLKLFHKANSRNTKNYFVCNLLTATVKRDFLRAAVFLCKTPFDTALSHN